MSKHAWSGPSRALQTHLELFDKLHREVRIIDDNRSEGPMNMPRLLGWIEFAQTYSRSSVQIDDSGKVVRGGDRIGLAGLADGRSNQELSLPGVPYNDEDVKMTATSMWRTEHDLLNEATTYYISGEMTDLVTEAANLSEPEMLFPTDLQTPSGFLVLEEPLLVSDLHPITGEVVDALMPIRAIGWRQQEIGKRDLSGKTPGVVLLCYVDAESYNSMYLPQIHLLEPGLHHEQAEIPMIATEFHPWAFGTDWMPVDNINATGNGKIISSAGYLRRWFLAFSRLCWQRLLQPQPWHPNRAGYRQFERVRGREAPQATVLHLRRFDESQKLYRKPDPDNWVNWPYPYRIRVISHWKRQYFPKLGPARNGDGSFNEESHRRVFIEAYPRGPEHLPIQERDHIMAVVR